MTPCAWVQPCVAFAVLLAAAVPVRAAQGYPERPVRFIVPQAAGSATDVVGRIVAQALGEALGQQFVVDNRPGAGGVLGSEIAARARGDGYTLLLANISTHGVNPALHRRLPYDPVAGFTPVSMAATTPNVLVVHAALPVRTPAELLALAKARPGKLLFGSAGNGSSQHLATELLRSSAGMDSVHVPYKGGPPAMTALIAGEVSWMIPTLTLSLGHVKAGRVRGLAVTSSSRSPQLPDLPVLADTVPGYEVVSWYGIAGPAGMPPAVVARLQRETARALGTDTVRKGLAAVAMAPAPGTPEAFATLIRDEIARWTRVARSAKLAPG